MPSRVCSTVTVLIRTKATDANANSSDMDNNVTKVRVEQVKHTFVESLNSNIYFLMFQVLAMYQVFL